MTTPAPKPQRSTGSRSPRHLPAWWTTFTEVLIVVALLAGIAVGIYAVVVLSRPVAKQVPTPINITITVAPAAASATATRR